MREILFRAFHKNEKKMYPVFSFCHAFVKIEVGIGTATEKIPINLFEPLMQFTGLTDKNRTKVFENDIIQFQNTEGEGLIKKVWYCDKMHSVMIGNLRYSTISESGFFQPSQLIFEVIGNIHDNPELLK